MRIKKKRIPSLSLYKYKNRTEREYRYTFVRWQVLYIRCRVTLRYGVSRFQRGKSNAISRKPLAPNGTILSGYDPLSSFFFFLLFSHPARFLAHFPRRDESMLLIRRFENDDGKARERGGDGREQRKIRARARAQAMIQSGRFKYVFAMKGSFPTREGKKDI